MPSAAVLPGRACVSFWSQTGDGAGKEIVNNPRRVEKAKQFNIIFILESALRRYCLIADLNSDELSSEEIEIIEIKERDLRTSSGCLVQRGDGACSHLSGEGLRGPWQHSGDVLMCAGRGMAVLWQGEGSM